MSTEIEPKPKRDQKPKHKCKTAYCRNDRAGKYLHCHKCRSRAYKARRPAQYFWNALVQNHKKQGIPLNITKQQYLEKFAQMEKNFSKPGANL